jgi:2-keto-4-pentenoate hydratase/2-oxohepta-3-ene-1,7-dioic acid hydratase in catechol pathway
MLIYRLAPDGLLAAAIPGEVPRILYSDPFETPVGAWELGRQIDLEKAHLLPPLLPRKIVGVGRSYREHAEELGNPVPEEPLLFLKSPTSVVGPKVPIVLPPESRQVDFEGEVAVVIRDQLRRAEPEEARTAVLGVTCACDVTARDLQRGDRTFTRAKSFDTFCPLGPAIRVHPIWEELEVVTRISGVERQRGGTAQMIWQIPDLVSYASRFITLEPGDVVLTGTPPGVGQLADGDVVEVEIDGVGILENPVEAWRRG